MLPACTLMTDSQRLPSGVMQPVSCRGGCAIAHALVLMHKHMLAAQANPYSDAFLCIQYSNLGWHPTLERMMGEL